MTCRSAAWLPRGGTLFPKRGGFSGDATGLRGCRCRFLVTAAKAGDEGDLFLMAGRWGAGTGAGLGGGLRGGAVRWRGGMQLQLPKNSLPKASGCQVPCRKGMFPAWRTCSSQDCGHSPFVGIVGGTVSPCIAAKGEGVRKEVPVGHHQRPEPLGPHASWHGQGRCLGWI